MKNYSIGKWIIVLGIVLLTACNHAQKPRGPFVYFRNYSRTFNDMNNKHLLSSGRLGIEPIASENEVGKATRPLKKLTSCRLFQVDKLTHSIPYLIPEAYALLEVIAENFKDSLDCKGLPSYSVIVTSVLRTDASVKKLRKKNINASANSAHLYGTTFDVAYARYRKDGSDASTRDKLKTVLAEVLRDLRKRKRCYVRYEYKQGCFHITVR